MAAAVFGIAFYAVYSAPTFFAELLIDGGVGTWLYKRANVKDEPDWLNAVLGQPPIKTTKIETDVVVDNGGTVVIGGVFTLNQSNTTERVPFFGDLPYIGFLFKQTNNQLKKRELLIFITPRILNDQLSLN